MKRNCANLKLWKATCRAVYKRASGVCEAVIGGERCGRYWPFEEIGYGNFAHKNTRNGASDEEVLDSDNIIFTCFSHHQAEHMQGQELKGIEYNNSDGITYVPDKQ